jgi:hypothetical protein
MQHTIEKLLTRATTLLQTSSQSKVFTQSYEAPKLRETQLCEFWDSRDKMPFRCGPCGEAQVYYKGEGGGFPQVRAMVNLVSLNLLVACPNTKNVPTMH